MLDRWMTKLAYSKAYTDERTQKRILAACYLILGAGLVLYLALSLPAFVTGCAAIPGALYFLIGLQALAYRKAIEGGDMMQVYMDMLPR